MQGILQLARCTKHDHCCRQVVKLLSLIQTCRFPGFLLKKHEQLSLLNFQAGWVPHITDIESIHAIVKWATPNLVVFKLRGNTTECNIHA